MTRRLKWQMMIEDEERGKETRVRSMGTSPVSMQNGSGHIMVNNGGQSDSCVMTPTPQQQFLNIDFSDDEKNKTQTEKVVKASNEIGVTDVTDDDDDELVEPKHNTNSNAEKTKRAKTWAAKMKRRTFSTPREEPYF